MRRTALPLAVAALACPAGASASFDVSYTAGSGLQITGSSAADSVFVGVSGKDGTDPNSADPPRVYIVFGSGPVPGPGCVMGSAIPAGSGGQSQTGAKCTIPTPTSAADIRIAASLGDGDDTLATDNFLLGGAAPASVLDLGAGNDRGTGSLTTETIRGGAGNDTLEGRDADDRLEGGTGNDILAPGLGVNLVFGQDGDDSLIPSGTQQGTTTGADIFSGGAGSDLASYAERTVPVTVSPSTADGQAGENDSIQNDVERLVGGSAGDALTLALAATTLQGSVEGRAGDDTLTGATKAPVTLTGGDGTDMVNGGPGPNILNMRDGIPEKIVCGDGKDQLDADLKDPIPRDCEIVAQGAILEGPNVRIRSSKLRADRRGRIRARLACPAALGSMSCAGTLRLTGSKAGPVARYSIVSGETEVVRARLSRPDRKRVAKRRRTVRAVSIEKGEFGSKTTIKPLVVLPPR